MSGKYEDPDGSELYILKRFLHSKWEILYIGISKHDVWNRWFGYCLGHMQANIFGEWNYNSGAGKVVIENMPKSLTWTIELWTRQECIDYLHNELIGKNFDSLRIEYLETIMMQKFRPTLNIQKSNYGEQMIQLKLPIVF